MKKIFNLQKIKLRITKEKWQTKDEVIRYTNEKMILYKRYLIKSKEDELRVIKTKDILNFLMIKCWLFIL